MAKREQDASRARKRYRYSVAKDSDAYGYNNSQELNQAAPRALTDGWGNFQSAAHQISAEQRKPIHPNQLFAALNVGGPESEVVESPLDLEPPRLLGQTWFSRRASFDGDQMQPKPRKDTPKRMSGMKYFISQDSSDFPQQHKNPRDAAKRRSKTDPSRTAGRHNPASAHDMYLENEYTVSFDILDLFKHESHSNRSNKQKHQSQSQDKPSWADGMRSRSLLNLPALLKKDKTQVKEDEVRIPEKEERPQTAHNRQKSLPITFVSDAVSRLKEEKGKRRQTFVGFFKKF